METSPLTISRFLNLYDNKNILLRICDWWIHCPELAWFDFKYLYGPNQKMNCYEIGQELLYTIKRSPLYPRVCENTNYKKDSCYNLSDEELQVLKDIVLKYEIAKL